MPNCNLCRDTGEIRIVRGRRRTYALGHGLLPETRECTCEAGQRKFKEGERAVAEWLRQREVSNPDA